LTCAASGALGRGFELLRVVLGLGIATSISCGAPVVVASRCDRVADVLNQLTAASDRRAFARDRGLDYDGTTVLVIVELAAGAPTPSVDGLSDARRSGDLVEARAVPDRLCAIAAADGVRIVRAPSGLRPVGALRTLDVRA
jgi:hypothetical protein